MGIFDKKPQAIPPNTKGAVHAVPCPHCGTPNDFRELEAHQLDTGDEAICDRCHGVMMVTNKSVVTVIHVRRVDKKSPPKGSPGQATTISAGQAQRMLGRG